MVKDIPTLKLNNGRTIPMFGLGTWGSPVGQVELAVKTAIDAGYRHIDCAHVYENEDEIGRAISSKIAEGVVKREDLFITSKLWNTFHHPDSVRRACETTLKNLKLEYVDLYLIHWPMSYKEDGDKLFPFDDNKQFLDGGVSILDCWKGMEGLIKAGLTKSIGVSNFNSRQIDLLVANAKILPVVNQVECHPYLCQKRLKAHCEAKNILMTAYSPLGSPHRPWAVKGEPQLMEEPKIVAIAKAHSKTPAQVLLRFQIQRGIVVFPKSVTASRIASNIDIFDFTLSDDEMKIIYSFDRNGRLCPESGAVNHRDHPFTNDEF